MKMIIILLIFILHHSAQGASVVFTISAPCRSVDFVPITGAAFDTCCVGGVLSKAPECANGVHSISVNAAMNIQKSIEISNASQSVSAQLTGVGYDPSTEVAAAPATEVIKEGGKPAGFAMNSGGGPSLGGRGQEANAKADLNKPSDSSSSGVSGASAGAGGLGFGLSGGSGSKSGTVGASGDVLASKDGSGNGGYTARGEASAGHGGSGSSGGTVASEGAADLRSENGKNPENENALNDEDGIGTAADPSDYFKMIDPSTSIFKVVSARYGRKKSLWTAGVSGQQIVPVINR